MAHLVQQLVRLGFIIVALDAQQNQQTGANLAHSFPRHIDTGMGDPLDQSNHVIALS